MTQSLRHIGYTVEDFKAYIRHAGRYGAEDTLVDFNVKIAYRGTRPIFAREDNFTVEETCGLKKIFEEELRTRMLKLFMI